MGRKLSIILLLSLVFASCSVTRSNLPYYDQEPQLIRVEHDGTYLIRSVGGGPNRVAALNEAKKNAVYEVLFDGISSNSSTMTPVKPVVLEVNAKEKYQDYFNAFFSDGGDYLKYVSQRGKRAGSRRLTKNRSQVMCHTDVLVDVPALKARLKADNILK